VTAAAIAPKPPDLGPGPGRDPWDRIPLIERFLGPRALAVPWRDRPRLLVGAGVAVAAMVALGWWLGRPSSAGPIDGAIPFASAPAAAAGPSVSAGGSVIGIEPAGPAGATNPAPRAVGPGSVPGTDVPAPVELVVHVAGAVIRPGIVHLAAGARVVDAIEAAGGAADGADLDQLNLAASLVDGVQVRVPTEGETLAAPISPAPAAPDGAAGAPPTVPAAVDLNRATAAELEQLPGIGPALAAAIVTWRTEHGQFKRVDDLLDVPGIGPAKMATLVDRVRV